MIAVRLGALQEKHRGRLREILDATAVFRPDEVSVALELFDERLRTADGELPAADCGRRTAGSDRRTVGDRKPLPAEPLDYEFVGAFDDDGELIGYMCFGAAPSTDRTYDLYWIATHPSAQGRGVGSLLLAEAETRLRDRNGRLLVVETSSRDEYAATHRFYTSRGYTEVARLRAFYAPGDDRVIYTKRLDPTARTSRSGVVGPQSDVRSPQSKSNLAPE